MRTMAPRYVLLALLLCLCSSCSALKCRTTESGQESEDFQYVVRMCVQRMRNGSDILKGNESGYGNENNNPNIGFRGGDREEEQNDNRRHKDRNSDRIPQLPSGLDKIWGHSGQSNRDKDMDSGKDDNNNSDDYDDEYEAPPRNRNRKRVKQRPPHSYQQQVEHDRDVMQSNRDQQWQYQGGSTGGGYKGTQQKQESSLKPIDACVIHCIFQEMHMLDQSGRPNKNVVAVRMTQRMRDRELKNFIQDAVDECFEDVDSDDSGSTHRRTNNNNNNNCSWSKNFAMCLEERGRQACDDWDTPLGTTNTEDPRKTQNTSSRPNRG